MKVILLKDIKRLGKFGDTVEVKAGYGRNYLIPSGLALLANKENAKKIVSLKKEEEKKQSQEKQRALALKEKIEAVSLTLTVQTKDDEELYGSVDQLAIAKALSGEGIDIEKDKIKLSEPIKKLGVYSITVSLSQNIEAVLKVWVVKK